MKSYPETKLFSVFTGLFVACLLISNLTSGAKLFVIGPFALAGGAIVFPLSYIFGDILTEVYGYERSRRVIWTGFAAVLLANIAFVVLKYLPAAPFWHQEAAYDTMFGVLPRILLASITAYFLGEFCNSYVVSKMKYRARGKRGVSQAARFVASTIVGEGVDSFVFGGIAFGGVLAVGDLMNVIVSIYVFKVLYEVVMLPISIPVANWVKKIEGIDHIDEPGETNYNPLHT